MRKTGGGGGGGGVGVGVGDGIGVGDDVENNAGGNKGVSEYSKPGDTEFLEVLKRGSYCEHAGVPLRYKVFTLDSRELGDTVKKNFPAGEQRDDVDYSCGSEIAENLVGKWHHSDDQSGNHSIAQCEKEGVVAASTELVNDGDIPEVGDRFRERAGGGRQEVTGGQIGYVDHDDAAPPPSESLCVHVGLVSDPGSGIQYPSLGRLGDRLAGRTVEHVAHRCAGDAAFACNVGRRRAPRWRGGRFGDQPACTSSN